MYSENDLCHTVLILTVFILLFNVSTLIIKCVRIKIHYCVAMEYYNLCKGNM